METLLEEMRNMALIDYQMEDVTNVQASFPLFPLYHREFLYFLISNELLKIFLGNHHTKKFYRAHLVQDENKNNFVPKYNRPPFPHHLDSSLHSVQIVDFAGWHNVWKSVTQTLSKLETYSEK
jgi:hypothetical protein